MDTPDELRYSVDHEWVQTTDDVVRIGITAYAQDALGDVVFVELPAIGTAVEAGGVIGEVESTKSVSEVYAPIAGEVVAVNTALLENPERLNSDPYGEGWICELRPSSPASVDALLDADAYRTLTGS